MKYDIARTESSSIKVTRSDKESGIVQFMIAPSAAFHAADLDNSVEKLSKVSLKRFKRKSELDELKIIGFETDQFTASFKVKRAELLDNGNFLIDARLLESPKHRDKKWNRADHIGKDFVDRHIDRLSDLPKNFKSDTTFDFEGFKAAKEHVSELQTVDARYDYSNISTSSVSKRRISPQLNTSVENGRPLQKTYNWWQIAESAGENNTGPNCDPSLGFSCSGWLTHNVVSTVPPLVNVPNYVGNPWLANTDANFNSPFYQATWYQDQNIVVQSSISTAENVPAWQWRNVWGTIEHQDGSLFDLNRETGIDTITFPDRSIPGFANYWKKTIDLGGGIDLNITLDIDIMPGLIFFTPAGFWAKLDPDNWAGAVGLSLRPLVSANLTGFDSDTDSYDIDLESQSFELFDYNQPCFEAIDCDVKLSIDVSADGTIDVNSNQDLDLTLGVQGTLVGRAGGIRNYDQSYAGAVVHDFEGFDSITGGSLSITVKPDLTFGLDLGIPESVSDFFQGWISGDLVSLNAGLDVPLTFEVDLDDLSSGVLPATVSGEADFTPSVTILPDSSLKDTVWSDTIPLVTESFTVPNIL